MCSVNPSMLWYQCRSTGNKWYSPHNTQNRQIIMRLRRHLPRMSCSYNEALHNQHLGWSIVHLIKIIVPDSRLYSSILYHRSSFYLNQLNWMEKKKSSLVKLHLYDLITYRAYCSIRDHSLIRSPSKLASFPDQSNHSWDLQRKWAIQNSK